MLDVINRTFGWPITVDIREEFGARVGRMIHTENEGTPIENNPCRKQDLAVAASLLDKLETGQKELIIPGGKELENVLFGDDLPRVADTQGTIERVFTAAPRYIHS